MATSRLSKRPIGGIGRQQAEPHALDSRLQQEEAAPCAGVVPIGTSLTAVRTYEANSGLTADGHEQGAITCNCTNFRRTK